MIAERPRPFIFVHIPKNAGTSIEKALLPESIGVRDFKYLSPRQRKDHLLPGSSGFGQHAKLIEIERIAGDLDRYYKFAIVRNPFERALSQIAYLRRFPVGSSIFPGYSWKDDLLTLAQSKQTIKGQDLGATQRDYLVGRDGSVTIDFVGRFENLQLAWIEITAALDLPESGELGWIFKTKERDLSACYDEESRDAIAAKYRDDFEAFDYDSTASWL